MWKLKNQIAVAAFLALLNIPAQAAPITGLYTTGVNNDGTSRADNDLELHYTLISPSPVTGTPFVATSAGGFPIGPWIGDSGDSAWISASTSASGPTGTYVYRLTFDLAGLDAATAQIIGQWAVDNTGLDILINGVATGNTSGGFTAYTAFSVNTGFIAGINTLDFLANDSGTPGGLRVGSISGTADALSGPPSDVPEPITLSLLGAGLAGIGMMRRRRVSF